MKIFVNRKIRRSPWGGGIHFLSSFVDFVEKKGHKITNQYDSDVDVIFMIDPRPDEGFGDINQLIQYKNFLKMQGREVKVIHRINDTDVARNTNFLVDLNIKSNYLIADHTIFISEWLKKHYEEKGFAKTSTVIRNGCNHNWFFPKQEKRESGPIRVVTHHWSDNFNKGFDAYIELDKQLNFRSDIEFTYVGRYYKQYTPSNTKIVDPLYGEKLGDELRKHDVYITAARWEACGMHHVEASSCGLPIVYHKDGGGIPEMCRLNGIELGELESICDKIYFAFENKAKLVSNISYNALSSETVNDLYLKTIVEKICHT